MELIRDEGFDYIHSEGTSPQTSVIKFTFLKKYSKCPSDKAIIELFNKQNLSERSISSEEKQ